MTDLSLCTDLEISDEWEKRFGVHLNPEDCIPAQNENMALRGELNKALREIVDLRMPISGAAQAAGMQEVLDFLNKIEGDGYGGMASFEIAREHVRSTLSIQHVLRPADNADHVETVGRAIEIASEASRCPPPHKTVFAEQLDIQRTASRGTSDGKTP